MGDYLNPGNVSFQKAINSKIYVDKTGLIALTNDVIDTEDRFVCVSRPRRFGKSMTANMLAAYYSKGCDSREMFSKFKIAGSEDFEKHLNKYNVIRLNMTEYSSFENINDKIKEIERALLFELTKEYHDVDFFDITRLIYTLKNIYSQTNIPFIFIIDEWDCIFREQEYDAAGHQVYLNFLRDLLKDKEYVALAYMTGILPVRRYCNQSALNMFTEVSMTNTREYSEFTGFTDSEVKELCDRFNKPYDEMKYWYDGYDLNGISIYNPRSVVMSLTGGFANYWTQTAAFEALTVYIKMNLDGLRDDFARLLSNEKIRIDTTTYVNDMVTFNSKDDVFTLLVHLGYLTYDFFKNTVSIPNYEIAKQFSSTIKQLDWGEVARSLQLSDELLAATLAGKSDKVAELIRQCHTDNTSILKYNDENSLACVISLAYYSAREKYEMWRELPTGEGFADIVFLPRKSVDLPALVIELKRDKSAVSAIDQIKSKKYADNLKDYSGEVLLVGINYDTKEKTHSCVIEKISV